MYTTQTAPSPNNRHKSRNQHRLQVWITQPINTELIEK